MEVVLFCSGVWCLLMFGCIVYDEFTGDDTTKAAICCTILFGLFGIGVGCIVHALRNF